MAIFSSMWSLPLAEARRVAPELPRGLLLGKWADDTLAQAAALDCLSIHYNHKHLTAERVAQLKQAGYYLFCYTVNDLDRARTLLEWGVDSICTDRLDLFEHFSG